MATKIKTLAEAKSIEEVSVADVVEICGKASERFAKRGDRFAAATTKADIDESGRVRVVKATAVRSLLVIDKSTLPSRFQSRDLKFTEGDEARCFPWICSDERVDRHKDIVRQHWALKDFQANPVVFFNHAWFMPAIGASLHEEVGPHKSDDYDGPALQMQLFLTSGTAMSKDISTLVEIGVLRTGSVGFYPGAAFRVKDDDEREALGLDEDSMIFGSEKKPNTLLEFSITNLPANVGAKRPKLLEMAAKGLITPGAGNILRELARTQVPRGPGDLIAWRTLDESLLELCRSVFPDFAAKHTGLDEPIISSDRTDAQDARRGEATLAAVAAKIEELDSKLSDRLDTLGRAVEDIRDLAESRGSAPGASENPASPGANILDCILGSADGMGKIAAATANK